MIKTRESLFKIQLSLIALTLSACAERAIPNTNQAEIAAEHLQQHQLNPMFKPKLTTWKLGRK